MVARDGGCDHTLAHHRRTCGDGPTCREPTLRTVADVSPRWGGQASIGALELRSSGARQWPVRRGRHPATQTKPWRKRRHHEHEACDTGAHQCCDPPLFETEQRNHPRCRHLPDRIMPRRCRDARFRGGYLGPVGCAGSTVAPAIPASTNTRGRREDAPCFMTRISLSTS